MSDKISHVGVLGMRWGVRKNRSSGSKSSSYSKRRDQILREKWKMKKDPKTGKYKPTSGTAFRLIGTLFAAKVMVHSGKTIAQVFVNKPPTKVVKWANNTTWIVGG